MKLRTIDITLPRLITRNSFSLLALVRKAGRMKNKKRYKRNKIIKDYNV